MKIRFGRILAIGVPLGILCAVIKNYFNIPNDLFGKYYCIFGVAAILLTVVINGAYHFQFGKKLNELTKILLEDKDVEQFIEGNKRLLNKTKGRYHRALIHINLSAGYCDKGEFETAKEVLLRAPEKDLKGINKTIYYISLTYIHFRLNEIQNALFILERFDKDFAKLENHMKIGGNIVVLRIFDLIYKDELEAAKALLDVSKEKWTDVRLKKPWAYLKEVITEKETQK